MNEMFVAKLWMVGVLAMMLLFGIVAVVGYYHARRAGTLVALTDEQQQ